MATPSKPVKQKAPKPPQPIQYLYKGDPRAVHQTVEVDGSRWFLDGRRPVMVVDTAIEARWLAHPLIAAAIANGSLRKSTDAVKAKAAADEGRHKYPLTSPEARVVISGAKA